MSSATTNYLDLSVELDAFSWPGGYPIVWIADIDTHNCATFCADCAMAEREAGGVSTLTPSIHWEGEPETCDGCGKGIEPAYAGAC
jgi:hypothetical protein